jgi:hypothetical protein
VDVCLSDSFDRLCCFLGGSSESRRLVNRDDDEVAVWIEALFNRLMTGGGDGERARLRY